MFPLTLKPLRRIAGGGKDLRSGALQASGPLPQDLMSSHIDHEKTFTATLSRETLEAFQALTSSREYPRGSHLFDEQQSAKYVFFIDKGRVKLFTTSSGGRIVILRIARPGDVVGLSAALIGATYDVSAQVMENCRLKVIAVEEFLHLLRKYPEASMAATQSILSEYQRALEDIRRLTLPHTVAGRIAALLLEWSKAPNQLASPEDRIILALTHEELAAMTGTSRETVSRTLQHFRQNRLISINGSSMRILKRAGLEKVAA